MKHARKFFKLAPTGRDKYGEKRVAIAMTIAGGMWTTPARVGEWFFESLSEAQKFNIISNFSCEIIADECDYKYLHRKGMLNFTKNREARCRHYLDYLNGDYRGQIIVEEKFGNGRAAIARVSGRAEFDSELSRIMSDDSLIGAAIDVRAIASGGRLIERWSSLPEWRIVDD